MQNIIDSFANRFARQFTLPGSYRQSGINAMRIHSVAVAAVRSRTKNDKTEPFAAQTNRVHNVFVCFCLQNLRKTQTNSKKECARAWCMPSECLTLAQRHSMQNIVHAVCAPRRKEKVKWCVVCRMRRECTIHEMPDRECSRRSLIVFTCHYHHSIIL